ncbi:MAG: bifunctional phosphopantothenoylcysteine decarboxylase/phosphopantothenate--cysteine ligase CoaBC [Chitinophagales bacterium]|nr:bifunctional phosphopantothenoylcysteine decarboxylase/phosphopantothenate--cysteine ligase CoaBC [Chitinophagales bacterium]
MGLSGKNILIGISGSIAAYKSAILVRLLVKCGANVRVVMTPAATDFIAPLTLATLSKNECAVAYTNAEKTNWTNHVDLALWADVIIIAPATANTIAKMANGLCDNLLIGIYLSARCPVYLAPAMDEDMWKHPSTQNNLQKLITYGNTIIPVNSGELASGLIGPGRMAEPEEIIHFLEASIDNTYHISQKSVLITAGPSYEPIDPVRFIGNHSTGKMGIALAEQAKIRGANVTLVLGPTLLEPKISGIHTIRFTSSTELMQICAQAFEQMDVCIFAAAVADYKPAEIAPEKIKKKETTLDIHLVKTNDIAESFGKVKRNNQLSVGFALETENELEHALQKIKKKNFDFVVLNSLRDKGAGFRHETNKITILDKQNNLTKFELKNKGKVAEDILDYLENLLK